MAGEKRNATEAEETLRQETAILLDIEGTTSSISFVKDTLFPYIRECLKKHVDEKWDSEEFKDDFMKLNAQAKEDEQNKVDGFVSIKEGTEEEAKESLIKNVLWQMDNDRKTEALKQLQGNIWKAAHKSIKGHVYDDVPKAFEEWTKAGKKLYIYSSGSVQAQKLLFGDSTHGDLLKFINGHFDTSIGPKQEADSYKKILEKINCKASEVLFLTDAVKEAEAAITAGLSVVIVVRKGNVELTDEEMEKFKSIESFDEISFELGNKRPKIENESTVQLEQKIESIDGVEKKDDTKKNFDSTLKSDEAMDTTEGTAMEDSAIITDNIARNQNEELKEKMSEEVVEKMNIDSAVEIKETPVEKKLENGGDEKENAKSKKEESSECCEKLTNVQSVSEKLDAEKSTGEKITKLQSEEVNTEKNVDIDNLHVNEKLNYDVKKPVDKEEENQIIIPNETSEESTEKKTAADTEEPVKKTDVSLKEVSNSKKESSIIVEVDGIVKKDLAEITDLKKPVEVEKADNKAENQLKPEITSNKIAEEILEIKGTVTKEEAAKTENEITKINEKNLESEGKKKLNGTTTNGDVTKIDDKNGVCGKTEVVETDEAIKLKKSVADGAGEPEIVNHSIVAATS
ncbi:enolase-phosphatase E1 [Trichogramma pretiosum]|uniref:enolase-phosphatase E1 n=1 Tax=Trichogramma pretiosum TaxID=7493 RepID=UPI0006C9CF6D|nr:enolase-phosphatase E1 [Trichogramma pretiosum]